MRNIAAAVVYFALVFAAGFAMGVIRVPFLVPRLGVRVAELLEMPFMFAAIVLSARFVVRRFAVNESVGSRLLVGFGALALADAAELLMAMAVQGMSFMQLVASRDPVSGTVFLAMLGLFAVLPLILARIHGSRVRSASSDGDPR